MCVTLRKILQNDNFFLFRAFRLENIEFCEE